MAKGYKSLTPMEKVELVRRHLLDGVPVSQICEEQSMLPGQLKKLLSAPQFSLKGSLHLNGRGAFSAISCTWLSEVDTHNVLFFSGVCASGPGQRRTREKPSTITRPRGAVAPVLVRSTHAVPRP